MNVPEPQIESHRRGVRLVWIVPIAAAIVGMTLLIDNWRERGPEVSITFQSGEGLEVGKTLVKYRDVTIGRVSRIVLSDDRTQVEVTADLVKSAADLAVEGSMFWVVRPRIGVGWASGLGTLLSGAYIGVESGRGGSRTHFTGLEVPPPLVHAAQGRRIVLGATDLGSLSIGAPVYYRHYQVGQIIDEHLEQAAGARVVLFVDAPNDRFVSPTTRFWNASGVDLNLSADGLKLRTQSVASVVAGGIAFDDGPEGADANASPPSQGTDFTLYKDEQTAMAPPDGEPHLIKMRFEKPLRGLTLGAPIEFVGVEIGSVTAIDVGYEPDTQHFPLFVTGKLYPRRMGLAYTTLLKNGSRGTDDDLSELARKLTARGLRVQPRSGNLLTGRLYLALDFIPDAPPAHFNPNARPVELATIDSNLGELQTGITQVVKKINALPLQRIAGHADQDLTDLHATLERINGGLLPAATDSLNTMHETLQNIDQILADESPLRSNVEQTLDDVQRTLRSVKALADYLDRHPDALIRGRSAAPSPPHPPGVQQEPKK